MIVGVFYFAPNKFLKPFTNYVRMSLTLLLDFVTQMNIIVQKKSDNMDVSLTTQWLDLENAFL